MTELQRLKSVKLDFDILSKSSNNHERRKYIRNLISKELLEELITKETFSCLSIATLLRSIGIKTGAGQIINLAKEFGVKTLNLKESANSKEVRAKAKKTCLEKYGSENCLSKGTFPYIKRNKSVREKYGVDNVFQTDFVKEKSKTSMFEKYGVTHCAELPFIHRNNGKRSKIQVLVEKYLTELEIIFQIEVGKIFKKYNDSLLKIYSPIVDILIESKKVIIEIYGDKWHANPEIYKDTDLIMTWNGEMPAVEIRTKDFERKKQLESFGYKVIEIWEKDIRSNFEKVKG